MRNGCRYYPINSQVYELLKVAMLATAGVGPDHKVAGPGRLVGATVPVSYRDSEARHG
jgi:hypothetical protein